MLHKGTKAMEILTRLKEEKQIVSADLSFARGTSSLPGQWGGIGEMIETEILEVMVPEDRSEEIFEFIYDVAEIDKVKDAFLYMGRKIRGVSYVIPEIPDDLLG